MARVARLLGLTIAAAGILVDQAHKAWMLGPFAIDEKGRVAVAPFLDLVMVWNRGVSYGLLSQDGELGRWLLVLVGVGGAILFGWWLLQTRRLLSAVALGFIIGGAVSNVVDRLVHGAVADFFLFHAGGFEWYVFNLADVWIVAGVAGLLLAWATERREIATEA
ncbi:MAG TPA: signal peptidase II [Propylenella sp.]|nr:signal peptidase II [Propylenella sp.]